MKGDTFSMLFYNTVCGFFLTIIIKITMIKKAFSAMFMGAGISTLLLANDSFPVQAYVAHIPFFPLVYLPYALFLNQVLFI